MAEVPEARYSSDELVLAFKEARALKEARRRWTVIEPLLTRPRSAEAVRERALAAGVHPTTVYAWLRRYEVEGTLAGLRPQRSDGGRGRRRLAGGEERVIAAAIDEYYAAGEPVSIKSFCEQVRERCREANLHVPHANTIRARLSARRSGPEPAPEPARIGIVERLRRFLSPKSAKAARPRPRLTMRRRSKGRPGAESQPTRP